MSKPIFTNTFRQNLTHMMLIAPLLFLLVSTAQAKEEILNFHSNITVNPNGSLNIVETITVMAQGNRIKRGIYRDLPTSYAHPKYGTSGFKSKAPIDSFQLQRNGDIEPFHIQKLDNGIRIFFGTKNRLLKHGEHTYTLSLSLIHI